jgi:two-component sensor histidine kinase
MTRYDAFLAEPTFRLAVARGGVCSVWKGMSVGRDEKHLADTKAASLSAALAQHFDCIKLLDQGGAIRYINEPGLISLDFPSLEEARGTMWIDRWQPSVRPLLTEALRIADSGQVARFTAARIMDDNKQTWWDVSVTPLHVVDDLPGHYLVMSRDITPEIEDEERQTAVTAEMRHRLKNTLGLAAGLILASARGRDDCHDFAGEVLHRLAQLATAQELVFGTYPVKCFSQVLTLLGAAYLDCGLEFGEVPKAQLSDRSVQALALVFGELATNSVKYGALKRGDRVRVSGEVAGTLLKLCWREETEFGPQRRGGQGLKLLDRIVRSCGGLLNRVVEPETMTTEVYIPYVE